MKKKIRLISDERRLLFMSIFLLLILLLLSHLLYAQCSYNPMGKFDYLTLPINDYALTPTTITINDCQAVKVFWWNANSMSYCYTDSNGVDIFSINGYNSWIHSTGLPCTFSTVVGYGDLTPGTFHCFQVWSVNASRPSNFTSGANILMVQTPVQKFNFFYGGFNLIKK